MDALVNHLQVTTSPNFNRRGQVKTRVQYSYFISDHGPFIDQFAEGEDTPEAVKAAVQTRVDKLRAVGALQPGE